jgi:signal peptidase I
MSRTATRGKSKPAPPPAKTEQPPRRKETNRETVEALVVAIILALLIRGFEAEAFVIPTGSMAPTLMGRHKEVVCPQCGTVFAVNASEESDGGSGLRSPGRFVDRGTCVNCRFQARIEDLPSFKGDRILVMKFVYDLPFLPGASGPERWDVVVFKYPEDPETNYIKRLIGMPDEIVRIVSGNVLTRPRNSPEGTPFRVERKPLMHQRAMQILVYDDTHRPQALATDPKWQRWSGQTDGAWKEEPDAAFVSAGGTGSGWDELRYSNLVPDPEQWEAVINNRDLPHPPRPTLVTDFYSYNSSRMADSPSDDAAWLQPHWVGDLTLSLRIQVTSNTGKIRFELVEGGVPNRCELDVATGQATLRHGDQTLGQAETRLKGPGTYDVEFANVDDRLTLWVDGGTPFGAGVEYGDSPETRVTPTMQDLQPAAVAVQGASARVSGLVLKRDIYYTQDPGRPDYDLPWDRYYYDSAERAVKMFDLLADPVQFGALAVRPPHDYAISPGRYMMMGDNSPKSKDGRGWSVEDRQWDNSGREFWEVPAALFIGKAFFIYWPHGKPFGPDIRLGRDFRIPFRPYFERMKWIR